MSEQMVGQSLEHDAPGDDEVSPHDEGAGEVNPRVKPRRRQDVPIREQAVSPLYWSGLWGGGLD